MSSKGCKYNEFCKTKHSGWCKSESVQSKCEIYLNNEIERLQSENTRLKAEVNQYKEFKNYFDSLYGKK